VITEDDYIDYLSAAPAEAVVPHQVLATLRDSSFLFLGYTMRDWSLRVFLQRVWGGQKVGAKSWAIESGLDVLEREFWEDFGVDVFDLSLSDYAAELERQLAALPAAHVRR
jgi:hypothetical protein